MKNSSLQDTNLGPSLSDVYGLITTPIKQLHFCKALCLLSFFLAIICPFNGAFRFKWEKPCLVEVYFKDGLNQKV